MPSRSRPRRASCCARHTSLRRAVASGGRTGRGCPARTRIAARSCTPRRIAAPPASPAARRRGRRRQLGRADRARARHRRARHPRYALAAEVAGAAAARSRHALVVRSHRPGQRADRAAVAAARRQSGGRRRPLPRRARFRRVRPQVDVHALGRGRSGVAGRQHRAGRRGAARHRLPAGPRLSGGTAALDATGAPLHRAGVSRTVPGLAYVGLEFQRSFRSNTVRGVGADAQRVVETLTARRAESAHPRVARRSCCPGPAR